MRGYATATATGSNDVALQTDVLIATATSVATEPKTGVQDALELSVQSYPSPARQKVTFRISLPVASEVGLSIYDAMGRLRGHILQGVRAAGRHDIPWDTSHLPSGVYFYRLQTERGVARFNAGDPGGLKTRPYGDAHS